jgi:hypothetical protein
VNTDELIAALDLPSGARVDRRVPKTLLVEHGAPTSADRRRINEGIEHVHWLAALKPTTIGVPAFRDEVREYLEIAILTAELRADAKAGRLAELIHRAVPYPVVLISSQGGVIALSLSHKRWSQGEAGATVLEGGFVAADLPSGQDTGVERAFVDALALSRQPSANLYTLYQGWIDAVLALLAARLTGSFAEAKSPEQAAARRIALADCARLEAQMAGLRAAAAREKQLAHQVELNLQLKRLEAEHSAARGNL